MLPTDELLSILRKPVASGFGTCECGGGGLCAVCACEAALELVQRPVSDTRCPSLFISGSYGFACNGELNHGGEHFAGGDDSELYDDLAGRLGSWSARWVDVDAVAPRPVGVQLRFADDLGRSVMSMFVPAGQTYSVTPMVPALTGWTVEATAVS